MKSSLWMYVYIKHVLFQWKVQNKELNACGSENAKYRVVFESSSFINRLKPFVTRLPELASAKQWERLDYPTGSTPTTWQNIMGSFQVITRRVKLLTFTSLRWSEIASKRTTVTTLHVDVVWALLQNKASHRKQRQLSWCFPSLVFFLTAISVFVTNLMSFIKAFGSYLFCWNLAKLVIKYSFNASRSVANNGLRVAIYLLQTNSSFQLRESKGRFNLSQICPYSEAKNWKPANHHRLPNSSGTKCCS